jgi:hypothetical protein
MKKETTNTIVISAVVAILASVLTFLVMSSTVGLSPKVLQKQMMQATPELFGTVNAHKCNADGTCETNSIQVENTLGIAAGGVLDSNGHAAFNTASIEQLTVNQNANFLGNLNVNGTSNLDPILLEVTKIDDANGVGNEVVTIKEVNGIEGCTEEVGQICDLFVNSNYYQLRIVNASEVQKMVRLSLLGNNGFLVPGNTKLKITEVGGVTVYDTQDMSFAIQPL